MRRHDDDAAAAASFDSNKLSGVQLVPHSPFTFQQYNATCRPATNQRQRQRLVIVQKVWHQRPGFLRPIHSVHLTGDKNFAETVANVLTSLPFIGIGLQAPRKNVNCRMYANSLIGVGIASSIYHVSRGRLRKYLRWGDYTMIATATVCLSRALRKENPKLLMTASALFLPVQPLMVSALHTALMEVSFAKRAFEDPELRKSHRVHKMSSLLGGAFFIADDLLPKTPFLHAAWHLAAAVALTTCNKLLL